MNTIDDPRPAAPAVLPPAPPLTEDWADTSPRRPLWRRLLPWVLLGAGVIVAAAWWWWSGQPGQGAPRYQTERVTRGTLQITVVANGTLAPTRAVSVGSELSGTVARVLVDVNDRVRKGQLLVELDTSRLQDEIARAQAAEASARARVAQTAATLQETRAQAARKEDVWQLSGGKVPSAAELDAARAAVERKHPRAIPAPAPAAAVNKIFPAAAAIRPDSVRHLRRFCLFPREQCDRRASLREGERHGFTEALAGTGHESKFSMKGRIHAQNSGAPPASPQWISPASHPVAFMASLAAPRPAGS
jgi:hypothetical protein